MSHLIKENHKTLKDFLEESKNHHDAFELATYLLDCAVVAINRPMALETYLKSFRPIFIQNDLMEQISFYTWLSISNYHVAKSKGLLNKHDVNNVSIQISSYNYLISKLCYELFDQLDNPEDCLSYMIAVETVDDARYKKKKTEADEDAKEGLYSFLNEDISKTLNGHIFRFLSASYLYSSHTPMKKELDWCNIQFSGKCQGKEICFQLQKALENFFAKYNNAEKDLDDLNRIQKEITMVNTLLKHLIHEIYARGEYCRYDYDDLQIGHHIENIDFTLEKGLLHFIPVSNGSPEFDAVNSVLQLAYQFDSYLEKEEGWESFKESLMGDFSYLSISKLLNEGYLRFYEAYRQKDVLKNSIALVSHQVHLLNRMLKSAYAELYSEGYSIAIPFEKIKIKERI